MFVEPVRFKTTLALSDGLSTTTLKRARDFVTQALRSAEFCGTSGEHIDWAETVLDARAAVPVLAAVREIDRDLTQQRALLLTTD